MCVVQTPDDYGAPSAEASGEGAGGPRPATAADLRELAIVAGGLVVLAKKLERQTRELSGPLPHEEIAALITRVSDLQRSFEEPGALPASASAPAPSPPAPASSFRGTVEPSAPAATEPSVDAPDDAAPPAPASGGRDPIALLALDMATSGHTREEVDTELREVFGATDTSEVLDEVFGDGSEDAAAEGTRPRRFPFRRRR